MPVKIIPITESKTTSMGELDATAPDAAIQIGAADPQRVLRPLTLNEDQRLRVTMAKTADAPVYVVLTSGKQSYYHTDLTDSNTPARVESVAGPFNVGGTSLTVDINGGGDQVVAFPATSATAGIAVSGPNPATQNGNHHRIKVSIDGGCLKKITISKHLKSGAAIAAALQEEIRDHVQNGTNVTVEYDTAEYPLRYVITSGTTGSNSRVLVKKYCDLIELLRFDTWGGFYQQGTNANYYTKEKVINKLSDVLTDVQVGASNTSGAVYIETVDVGPSASLEVTAGGANTAFQFTTDEVTGVTRSGSSNMGVDGSSTPVRFSVDIPPNKIFIMKKLLLLIRDDDINLKEFGGRSELANGLKISVKSENSPLIPVITGTTNADLMSQAEEGTLFEDAFGSGGKDLIKVVFDFGAGVRMPYDSNANVYVTVQDNLTAINSIYVRAKGWIE